MESKKDDSKVVIGPDFPVAIAASLLFLFPATSSLDGRDLGNELNSVYSLLSVLVPAIADLLD